MPISFVFDVHIPPSLVALFRGLGHTATHALELGLATSPDAAIWDYAVKNNSIIVTKDKDFVQMALAQPGPCVILVCIGNSTNKVLQAKFSKNLPEILTYFAAGEQIVELR